MAAWGEKTGDTNLDNKLWPRAAALAERFGTHSHPVMYMVICTEGVE